MRLGPAVVAPVLVALLLSGCQTLRPTLAPIVHAAPPKPAPVRVVRPPPTPAPPPRRCVPKSLPPEPRYPDTDAALRNAGGAADRYQLIAAGRLLRIDRLRVLEKTVAGCR